MSTKILMFGGKIHSGKNLAAKMAKEYLEKRGKTVSCLMLAQGVKDGCKRDFAPLVEFLNSLASECAHNGDDFIAEMLHVDDENWYENKTELTRILLQIYGTEIFRDNVDKNWWSKKMGDRIDEIKPDVVIITDFRFPSEYEYLAGRFPDVETVSIVRDEIEARFVDNTDITMKHSSETSLDNFKFDHIIDNNGDEKDLEAKVESLLKEALPCLGA